MFQLSPRFLALPLIALTVILTLPRQPDPSAAQMGAVQRATVVKASTCTTATASCMVAESKDFLVR